MSLNDATSQYIDLYGKCRVLNFGDVSVATSPLPPLDIPEVPKSETIMATVERAIDFINNTNLQITEQDVDIETQLVKGFWVKSTTKPPEIAFGYVPVDGEKAQNIPELEKVQKTNETIIDPIYVEGESYLQIARNNEKIAEYLKEYSLYEWSQNPSKFGPKNYVVVKGHTYDLEKVGYRMNRNAEFYKSNSIIVTDKETISKLISFVNVSALNDSTLERRYKSKKSVDVSAFFKYLTDFKSEQNQIIFLSKGSIVSWLSKIDDGKFEVSQYLKPDAKTPYYYRNISIENGKLMLLQNTKLKSFASALAVSKEWEHSKTNVGYNPINIFVEENPNFEVYTDEGMTHRSDKKGDFVYKIFGYDDGTFAALLFL